MAEKENYTLGVHGKYDRNIYFMLISNANDFELLLTDENQETKRVKISIPELLETNTLDLEKLTLLINKQLK